MQRPILQMIRPKHCCCGWPGAPGCTVRQASGQSAGATCGHCWSLPGRIPKASAVQPGRHGSQMRRTRPMPMPATGCAVRHCLHCRARTVQRWKPCPILRKGSPRRCLLYPEGRRAAFRCASGCGTGRHHGPGSLHGMAAWPAFRCGCACSGSGHARTGGSCAGRRGKICAAAVRSCTARQRCSAADRPGALLCRRRMLLAGDCVGTAPEAG